jgi:hypothetical protein
MEENQFERLPIMQMNDIAQNVRPVLLDADVAADGDLAMMWWSR